TAESTVYSDPILINEETTIKAIAVKDGLTDSKVSVSQYMIGLEDLRIHDIQGAGHYSPYANQQVSDVEGIVTKVVDSSNFYMQDQQPDEDKKTSEGILVYKKGHGVSAGDVVSVSG